MNTPSKGGRPPVADKRRVRGVRFNDAEWDAVCAAAESAGLPVAEWVRDAVEAALSSAPK